MQLDEAQMTDRSRADFHPKKVLLVSLSNVSPAIAKYQVKHTLNIRAGVFIQKLSFLSFNPFAPINCVQTFIKQFLSFEEVSRVGFLRTWKQRSAKTIEKYNEGTDIFLT